jgi:hypothetical protein
MVHLLFLLMTLVLVLCFFSTFILSNFGLFEKKFIQLLQFFQTIIIFKNVLKHYYKYVFLC